MRRGRRAPREIPLRCHLRSPRGTAWLAVATVLLLTTCSAPTAPTVDVQGRLAMGPGVPVAGVLIHTQGRLVTSDADGRFALIGVTTPYTLTVASTGDPAWAYVAEGLTEATPLIAPPVPNMPWARPGGYRTARITGATPNTNPLPPGQRLELSVEGIDAAVVGRARVEAGGDAYDLDVAWWTPGDVDVRLHALLLQVDAADRPTDVLGYGTVQLTLAENATVVQTAPTGTPPATAKLQGAVAPASGGVPDSLAVGVRLGGPAVLPLVADPAGAAIDFVAPAQASRPLAVTATATFAAGGGFAWATVDPSTPFTLELPAPPQQLAPVDGADGVTATTAFTLVGDPDRMHEFTWRRIGGGERLTVTLLTHRTSATLPDLAPVGLAWAPGGTYAWSVSTWHAHDADAAARLPVRDVWLALGIEGSVAMDGDGWFATTFPDREVTLAP